MKHFVYLCRKGRRMLQNHDYRNQHDHFIVEIDEKIMGYVRDFHYLSQFISIEWLLDTGQIVATPFKFVVLHLTSPRLAAMLEKDCLIYGCEDPPFATL